MTSHGIPPSVPEVAARGDVTPGSGNVHFDGGHLQAIEIDELCSGMRRAWSEAEKRTVTCRDSTPWMGVVFQGRFFSPSSSTTATDRLRVQSPCKQQQQPQQQP